ncbi:conjugal transfer protein TrbG, partial [Sinorhizobium medicae]
MIKRLLLCAACAAPMMTHAHAAQAPRPGSLDSRVTSVVYQSNNVVKVSATYGISTMLIFDEDEKFETISLGDTDSWQVAPSEKGNILFVKPIAKNVATNMNVVTSKRIYFLELNDHASSDGKQVFGIRFVYPEKDLNAALRKEAEYRAAYPNVSNVDKANVNIDYSFSGDPALRPLVIFDDGKKTFFKFGSRVPAIFAVQADFSETLRNFRKEGEYIVVDGVATQYTLREGNQWTCIFNLRKP